MKVKNIMFFGAAAVILSAAGANAAFIPGSTTASTDTKNIVTSKYYVDSGLDAKQNVQIAEAADAGKAVVVDAQGKINISANALTDMAYADPNDYQSALTAGANIDITNGVISATDTTYNTLTAQEVTTGTDTTGKLVTAKILRDELDDKQNIQIGSSSDEGKAVVVDSQGKISMDSQALGSMAYEDSNDYQSALTAGANIDITNGVISATDTTYNTLTAQEVTTGTDTTGKLVTAKILRDELDSKQGLLGGGTSGTVLTNSGVAGTVNATVVSSSIDTSVNTDDNNIPTVGAVEGLVSSATNGNVIPERTDDCALNSGKNCALVAEADGLHWRVMAGN